MKAMVDKETCISCELCVGICPEVFQIGDDGKSESIVDEVPSDAEDGAQEAKESCPVGAISVEE
ncbi:MAG: ferredoxin [Clostridium sp.]